MSALCSARGGGWTEHEATGLIAGVPVPDEAGKIDTSCSVARTIRLTEAIAGCSASGDADRFRRGRVAEVGTARFRGLRNPSAARPNIQFYVSDIPRSSPRWVNGSGHKLAGYAAPKDLIPVAGPAGGIGRKRGEKMEVLNETEITRELGTLAGWAREGKEIRKTFELADFAASMGFVVSVALLAEKANHHPDIDIRWNRVMLVLSTHSAGGLTAKDFALAARIEGLN